MGVFFVPNVQMGYFFSYNIHDEERKEIFTILCCLQASSAQVTVRLFSLYSCKKSLNVFKVSFCFWLAITSMSAECYMVLMLSRNLGSVLSSAQSIVH